jgi:hypothetical protein
MQFGLPLPPGEHVSLALQQRLNVPPQGGVPLAQVFGEHALSPQGLLIGQHFGPHL